MIGLRQVSIPLWVAVWFVLSLAGVVSARILPDPRTVLLILITDLRDGTLIYHTLVSAGRALAGFGLAVAAGVALGALIARSRVLDAILEPLIFMTYPVPNIALYPILTFAFGIGTPSKIAFAFIECFYPILIASIFAIRGVKPTLIWTAASMGASRMRIIARVIVPAALGGIFTGLRIALPLALIVIIVTEMIGDTRGLGFYIGDGSAAFRVDRVYVGIFMTGVLGFTLDRLLTVIQRFVFPKL